jgi:methanogenic corrinoid protein MtbC1
LQSEELVKSLKQCLRILIQSLVFFNEGLAAASDQVYQLLAHGRWFSPGTPASSTTKTGRHDIAEILLKVALKHQKSNQSINQSIEFSIFLPNKFMQYFDLQ